MSGEPARFPVRAPSGPSSPTHSERMSGVGHHPTTPEMALRRSLHSLGLRYRVSLPVPSRRRRSIDIAFTAVRVAVFVDGCFWHSCPDHGTRAGSNAEWWRRNLVLTRHETSTPIRPLRSRDEPWCASGSTNRSPRPRRKSWPASRWQATSQPGCGRAPRHLKANGLSLRTRGRVRRARRRKDHGRSCPDCSVLT